MILLITGGAAKLGTGSMNNKETKKQRNQVALFFDL
jgi:hypothetical protein